MSKQKFPPDLGDVLENLKSEILKEINCIQIGTIEAFDTDDQTATVSLNIKKIVKINDDGSKELEDRPLLLKCPCVILGGGDSHITFNIKVGDSCIVFFNDRDIDNWFYEGGKNAPNSPRTHDLSDGLVLVGARNIQDRITDFFTDGIRIKLDETNKIEMSPALTKSFVAVLWQIGAMIITGGLQIGGIVTAYTGGGGSDELRIESDILHTEDFINTGTIEAGNGWTGTFPTHDSRTVTVVKGIITDVS